jgi:WD40 repeat protein
LVAVPGSSTRWLFGVAWSPDSKQIEFGGTDYIVWVISLDGQQKVALYTLPGSQGWGIRDIAWSPQGKYIAVSTYFQGVHIIQSDTGTLVYAKTDMLVGDISALGWSPTDARIACRNGFSKLMGVQVWEAPMG